MTLAPEYQRPEGVIPETLPTQGIYSNNKVGTADEMAEAALFWDNYLLNDNLREVVNMAIEHNKDLKMTVGLR